MICFSSTSQDLCRKFDGQKKIDFQARLRKVMRVLLRKRLKWSSVIVRNEAITSGNEKRDTVFARRWTRPGKASSDTPKGELIFFSFENSMYKIVVNQKSDAYAKWEYC